VPLTPLIFNLDYLTVSNSNSTFQAIQRTRALLLQQGANRVLVNVLELFTYGDELDDDETEIAVELL
jgi:hypothetical protein